MGIYVRVTSRFCKFARAAALAVLWRKFSRIRPHVAHVSPVYWRRTWWIVYTLYISTRINDKSWQNDTCHIGGEDGTGTYDQPCRIKLSKATSPECGSPDRTDGAKKKEPPVIAREGSPSSNSISESNPSLSHRETLLPRYPFFSLSLFIFFSLSLLFFLFLLLLDHSVAGRKDTGSSVRGYRSRGGSRH